MRRIHFETLRPVCPVCRTLEAVAPLRLAQVIREEEEHIVEGVLHCSNQRCLREYPILDGIPLVIPNIRQYISDNLLALYARQDLSNALETMVGDCCGPSSPFEHTRQYLSSYAWDHYGDLDPQEPAGDPRPGSMLGILRTGCALASNFSPATRSSLTLARKPGRQQIRRPALKQEEKSPKHSSAPSGPSIDIGCAAGRSTFALAEIRNELALGVDLNFGLLRTASEVLRHGRVRYPRRRSGLVYERREFLFRFPSEANVDFWACDATALPFRAGTFSFATGLNVLDSVNAPRELLVSIGRVLKPAGLAVLTCPYDWSSAATPLEAWLGGHSQRSPQAGSSEDALRALLTPTQPGSVKTLRLIAERPNLPWHVRIHDRSAVTYKTHMVIAART